MSGGSSNNGKDNIAGAMAPFGVQQPNFHYQEEVILKVDGSLKRERRSAGCGGYLSSPSQNWICGFVQKLKFTPDLKEHEPEMEAIVRGMHWVKGKGKRKVAVISDCKTVVDSVNSEAPPSKDPLIREIRDLIDSDEWEATLIWIPRGQNGEADKLADKAHSCSSLELHQSENRSYLLNLNNQIPNPCNSSIMSGGNGNNGKDNKAEEGEGSGGGWASTFFKVAGAVAAAAAVAGSIYVAVKKQEAAAAPFGVRQPFHYQEEVILKVDGSLLRERLSAGCGGFLSSTSEKWICGFAQKLMFTLNSDETEREAILRGLRWVKEKGKKKVVAKTDNKGIAILVNSGRRCNDPVICDIRDLLNNVQWEASLSWIDNDDDENEVADRLAHKAHSFTSYDLQEFDDPPQNCLNFKIANSSIMSGGSSNNGKDNKDEEEGWASTFLKVAGAVAAAAAVAGSIYGTLKKPEADVAPYRVQQTHRQQEEEVTLRVDGSLKREKRSAGCGGYLSSPSQSWICGFVQKLEFTPDLKEHEPEMEAIVRGMHWVKGKGKRKVAVISDCKTVVDFVNSKTPSKDRLIGKIRDFIDSDEWDATLSWISRDQNGEADKLADKAHSCRSLEKLHQSNDRPYLLNLNNQIPHPWYV